MPADVLTSRLAFFGRLADDLTRRILRAEDFTVSVDGDARAALRKDDGHFALVDLEPSATAYQIRLGGLLYQPRTVIASLPTLTPVQVTYPGEDELYVVLSGAPGPQNHVSFDPLEFVAPIESGAAVLGQGAFTTTLTDPLEGRNVNFAVLGATAGLAGGQVLRIVRGPNLLLRPGPYYPFPSDLTVIAVRVVENDPAQTPITAASVTITEIDGAAPVTVTVGGLPLQRFALTASATAFVVLDAAHATATTNTRGDAVFYFPGSIALASLELTAAKAQYQTGTVTLNVTTRTRNVQTIALAPV
jgi:hypothetical protein